ncbi:MAG TPA: DUF2809 domain-containing protein [Blastocatellia bacterium]|nr:DUF2809 domain-containing protein [Blastocatellia bacterium]
MKYRFDQRYALLSLGLFLVEVGIALFIKDRLIRPFVGDMLVVILIFTVSRTFIETGPVRLACGVLIFAYAIEIGQYFNLVSRLGLQHHRLARIAIGTTFDLRDLLAYTVGILLIIGLEKSKPVRIFKLF